MEIDPSVALASTRMKTKEETMSKTTVKTPVLTLFIIALLALIGAGPVCAADETPAAPSGSDIQQHPSCKYCGMDRAKFSHSRVLVVYDDGKPEAFCSVHCAAVDLALNIDRAPTNIYVGDYGTKALLDAEKAYWVVGGAKPGVMSARGKWAFKTQGQAAAFLKESGGNIATFDEAMKAAYEDMYADTKAIRERRAAKRKMASAPPVAGEEKSMERMEHGHK
jgi:nitrous oxide reductase accessory protein NosL